MTTTPIVSVQADGNVVIKGMPIEWIAQPDSMLTLTVCLDPAVALVLRDALADLEVRA